MFVSPIIYGSKNSKDNRPAAANSDALVLSAVRIQNKKSVSAPKSLDFKYRKMVADCGRGMGETNQ